MTDEQQAGANPKVSGAEKAGVLLLTLGEDVAAEILQHMNPKEVQLVGSTMAAMNDVSSGSGRSMRTVCTLGNLPVTPRSSPP